MNILEVQLVTHCLADLRLFYSDVLGLSVLTEDATSFTVQCGSSRLSFTQLNTDVKPQYHFAFNIPRNLFPEAKAWITQRVALLTLNKRDQFHLDAWNSDSLYFFDPAGNILELIARHNQPDNAAAPFQSAHLLSISEIGLIVETVPSTVEALKQTFRIDTYNGQAENFAALGDEAGLFIISQTGRIWFPTDTEHAAVYPTNVVIQGPQNAEYALEGYPYHIQVRP